ncbi:MAG TPA: hypothetical protein VF400_12155 [Anaeromyxobacteraceae bacterium]
MFDALALAALAFGLATPRDAPGAVPAPRPSVAAAELLAFDELLEKGTRFAFSRRARALDGKRVRLAGFMVEMELPPRGAFYLVPRPLLADESGGGTADLPPQAVRVVVRSSPGEAIPFVARPSEVTGVLVLGNAVDEEGRVSAIRLVLDRREDVVGH